MIAKIQVRNDTAANWTSANPTLLVGEVGYETDTKKKKMGDGVTAWNSLEYNMLQASDLNDDDTVVKTTVDGVELFVGKSVGEMKALLGVSYDIYGTDDFISKYDAASDGAFLTVQPGSTFDFGSSSCILTDKSFNAEGCTFTSSANGGTFKDNSITCNCLIKGFPTINNTNGTNPLSKRIVLHDADSIVGGFYYIYRAIISQSGWNAPIVEILENTIGNIIWTRFDIGEYRGTLEQVFLADKTFFNFTFGNGYFGDPIAGLRIGTISRTYDQYITIESGSLSVNGSDTTFVMSDSVMAKAYLEIKIYP
jgi:hypothetical protein